MRDIFGISDEVEDDNAQFEVCKYRNTTSAYPIISQYFNFNKKETLTFPVSMFRKYYVYV